MIPEKETLRGEVLEKGNLAIEKGKGRKCMRQFVAIVARGARSLSSQLETSLFTVINVSQVIGEVRPPTAMEEEVTKDLDFKTKGCLMQYAVNVEKDFNFHLDQLEINQFIVTNVSIGAVIL